MIHGLKNYKIEDLVNALKELNIAKQQSNNIKNDVIDNAITTICQRMTMEISIDVLRLGIEAANIGKDDWPDITNNKKSTPKIDISGGPAVGVDPIIADLTKIPKIVVNSTINGKTI